MPIERAYPAEASGGGGAGSPVVFPVGGANYTDRSGTVSNTTEQDMVNWDMPANSLAAMGMLECDFAGFLLNNVGSANTFQFKVFMGATTLLTSNPHSIPANASARRFAGRLQIAFRTTALAEADFRADLNSTNDTEIDATIAAVGYTGEGAEKAVDLTAAQTIRITGKWGSSLSTSNWTIHKSLFKLWTPS